MPTLKDTDLIMAEKKILKKKISLLKTACTPLRLHGPSVNFFGDCNRFEE